MNTIILAGGLGTRLNPLTCTIPKPLLPVKGIPLVEWTILALKEFELTDIILSIGYKADMIVHHFGDGSQLGVTIFYNVEEEPLGTGGAVKDIVTTRNIEDPFVLVWGDNLANYDYAQLINTHFTHNAEITMTLTPRKDVEHFGVAELQNHKIVGFVEKPERDKAPSRLVSAGAFVVNPEVLNMLSGGNSSLEKDCFEPLCHEKGKVYAYIHTGYWFPTDTLEKYEKAQEEFPGVPGQPSS